LRFKVALARQYVFCPSEALILSSEESQICIRAHFCIDMKPDDKSEQIILSGTAYEQTCAQLSQHAMLPKLFVVPELAQIITRTQNNSWKLKPDVQGIVSALESKGVRVALVDGGKAVRQLGLDKIIILSSVESSSVRKSTGINASDMILLQSSVSLDVRTLRDVLVTFQGAAADEKGF
jgi:hypothetical protein